MVNVNGYEAYSPSAGQTTKKKSGGNCALPCISSAKERLLRGECTTSESRSDGGLLPPTYRRDKHQSNRLEGTTKAKNWKKGVRNL